MSAVAAVGAASVVAGVALIYPPAGLIVAGLILGAVAIGWERGSE